MFRQGTQLSAIALLLAATALLTPPHASAQRHGGGGGGAGAGAGGTTGGRPTICVHGCATPGSGLSSEDELKAFRHALAVQADPEQRAAFAKVTRYTQTALDQLKALHDQLNKLPTPSPLAGRASTLDEAIEQARAGNQNFLTSFTVIQKSGLKDVTAKLTKSDSDLDKEIKALDQIAQTAKPGDEQLANSATSLDKELSNFQSAQLAVGMEMGILLSPDGQDLVFNLPAATSTIQVSGQSLSIPSSGTMSRAAIDNGSNVFRLKLTADLSDLQQNITAILRAGLNRGPRCGEHIEIQQASLTPMIPASLVVVNLHYERWVCQGSGAMEVTNSDGELEVKLTPSLEANAGLHLVPEITRVRAEGYLRDLLRSGDLGESLRDQIAASILDAMQKYTDTNTRLPLPATPPATIQNVEFQDAGADTLNLIIQGQLQLTDDQTQQFAKQLKQRVSAQGTPAQ